MTIRNLKERILSHNVRANSKSWQRALNAADELVKVGGENAIDFLIELLSSSDSDIRNVAALALRESPGKRVAEALIDAIFKAENRNSNGTLVYALEGMDCSRRSVKIFYILFHFSYECRISALVILSQQAFELTNDDLEKIEEMWADYVKSSGAANDDKDEAVEPLLRDAYERFVLSYR